MKILADLPRIIPNHLLGWSGDCPESEEDPGRDFTYMIGTLVPMGTPIPEVFDYRVLRGTHVIKGILGMEMQDVIGQAKMMGYTTNYGDNYGWNAELYLDGAPDKDEWSWLIPVKKRRY